MSYTNDQSKKSSTAFDQATTLVTVVELSRNSWLVAGVVPGINRHPLKKLAADENELLALLHRWQQQAIKAGREIKRVVVAFEAGRDGFWLARWLRVRGIEPHVIHATSIAVSREHRRAKADRLDTEHLRRVVLGWLRVVCFSNLRDFGCSQVGGAAARRESVFAATVTGAAAQVPAAAPAQLDRRF